MKINFIECIEFIREIISNNEKMIKFKEIISDIKELFQDIKEIKG